MSNNENKALEKIENRIEQLQAQKKAMKQKENLKKKREQQKRWIEYGKKIEKEFDVANVEQLERLITLIHKSMEIFDKNESIATQLAESLQSQDVKSEQ